MSPGASYLSVDLSDSDAETGWVSMLAKGSWWKTGYPSNPVSFGRCVPVRAGWKRRECEGRCDGRQVSGLRVRSH